eukprot:scaffold2264_cov114-Isochrysis_galbana.AAC.1
MPPKRTSDGKALFSPALARKTHLELPGTTTTPTGHQGEGPEERRKHRRRTSQCRTRREADGRRPREVTSRRSRHKGVASASGENVKTTGRGGREGAFQPEERGLQQVAVGLPGNPPLPKEAGPDPPPGLPHMKRASGRLQRSQPVGRVVGSVDKVGGLVAAAGTADAARGGGSSEPVARDERAKACPTPKVGSPTLRRPREL